MLWKDDPDLVSKGTWRGNFLASDDDFIHGEFSKEQECLHMDMHNVKVRSTIKDLHYKNVCEIQYLSLAHIFQAAKRTMSWIRHLFSMVEKPKEVACLGKPRGIPLSNNNATKHGIEQLRKGEPRSKIPRCYRSRVFFISSIARD